MKTLQKKKEDIPHIWQEPQPESTSGEVTIGPGFEQWLMDSVDQARAIQSTPYTPAPRTGGSDYLAWADSRIRESDPGTALPSRPPQTGGSDYISWAESKLRESNPGTYLPHAGYRPGSADYLDWVDDRIHSANPGTPLPEKTVPGPQSAYASSVQGSGHTAAVEAPMAPQSDEDIMRQDLEIYNSWPKEDQDALLWYLDNRIGGRQDFLNIIGGTPMTVEEAARGLGYRVLEEKYGTDVVAQVAESVDRWRNQDLASREAAEAASIAQGSGALSAVIPRGLNLVATLPKLQGIRGSSFLSTGRYSTADPNNWGSRYGAYSQTLDRVNGDLAGQRLTNGLEFLSRMAQGAALPGSVDYTAPLTWYDSAEGTGARKLIDGGGRLLYDAAASAADDIIRRTVTMGLKDMPLPDFFNPEVAEKMPQIASSLMAAVNTYADNYAAYSADGTPIAQAKGLAAVDGILEAILEDDKVKRLLKIPDFTPGTAANVLTKVVLSAAGEIPEEWAAHFGSTIADIIIRRGESDFIRAMNEAKAEGRTGGQAFWYALGQEGLDLLREAAVTFLSGNLSGAATVGAKTLMHSQADPASSLTAPQGTAADPGGDPSHHPDADPTGQTDPTGQQTPQTQASPDGNTKQTVWETYLEAIQDYFFPQKAGDQSGQSAARNAMANTQPGAVQLPGTAQSAMQAQTPGTQNQTQAPGTKPGSGVSNFWNTYMDAVRSYFFPQNAGTQTATQTEIQTEAQAAQTNTRAAAQTQPQDAMQSGMQPQIQGTMQPDGQPQTQGTTLPNFQTQVPGESQPNAQAQTEKGQPLSPEKRIADLATDIKKSGMTTGKATIAAQELYQASQQYGPNAEAMLAAYEPGQDPKRFASGFQNAYILGTLGKHTALQDSKAAAYLTQQQRELAYEIGRNRAGEIDEKNTDKKKTYGKTILENQNNSDRIGMGKIGIQFFAKMPVEKFTKYALDPVKSPDKARAFQEALGYNVHNYAELMDQIRKNINEDHFVPKGDRGHGMRYEYVMRITGPNGKTANVLTAWIEDGDEKRLVTVFVTKKEATDGN